MGLLHPGDSLLVPLPEPIRIVLLNEELAVKPGINAEPVSGGGTDRVAHDHVAHPLASGDDVAPATLLLRLSYLYRCLLRARDADTLRRIGVELGQRDVPTALRAVYDAMLQKRALRADSPELPS